METTSSMQAVETPTEKPQPTEEKPEIEPRPKYSDGVAAILARSLGDDGRSQPTTENRQKEKGGEKGKLGKARSTQATGACHTKCYGCADGYHP